MESLKKVYEKITSDPPLYFLWTIAVVNVIITLSVYAQDEFRNIELTAVFTGVSFLILAVISCVYYGKSEKLEERKILGVGVSSIFNICFAIYLWVESLKFELDGWVAAAVIYTLIIVVFYIWFLYDMFAHLRKLEDFEKGFTGVNEALPKRDLRFRIEI